MWQLVFQFDGKRIGFEPAETLAEMKAKIESQFASLRPLEWMLNYQDQDGEYLTVDQDQQYNGILKNQKVNLLCKPHISNQGNPSNTDSRDEFRNKQQEKNQQKKEEQDQYNQQEEKDQAEEEQQPDQKQSEEREQKEESQNQSIPYKQNNEEDEQDKQEVEGGDVYQQQTGALSDSSQQQKEDCKSTKKGLQNIQRPEVEPERVLFVQRQQQNNIVLDRLDQQQAQCWEAPDEHDIQQNIQVGQVIVDLSRDKILYDKSQQNRRETDQLQKLISMGSQQNTGRIGKTVSEEQHLKLKRQCDYLKSELARTRESLQAFQKSSREQAEKCFFCRKDSELPQIRYDFFQHIMLCNDCHRNFAITLKVRP